MSHRLDLSDEEAVTLLMLSMVGATAFDSSAPIAANARRRFEEKFNIKISDDHIINTITKVRILVTVSGDEDVSIS